MVFKKSKIWMSMFLSYVLIITLCFLLYSALAVYETYMIGKERIERENQIELQELNNVIDQRLIAAQSAVSNINASTTIKQLYMSVLSQEKSLNSYNLYSILTDMKMIRASSNRIDVSELVIFVDSYSKAYSCTGVISLPSPFKMKEKVVPLVGITTISDMLEVEGVDNLTFSKTGLLYVADYTYSFGSSKGRIAVLFDLDNLKKDIYKIIGTEKGFRLMMGNDELLAYGNLEGSSYSIPSNVSGGLSVELYAKDKFMTPDAGRALMMLIVLGFVLILIFTMIAGYFAKRYYKPIGSIKELVAKKETIIQNENKNEMETILSGIKELIGERNGYREKMLTITPYVEQGMLHGMVTGNIEKESIQVLLEENYLDFQKPYFIVSVINILKKHPIPDVDMFNKLIAQVCDKLSSIFSTEERRIYTYKKDYDNIFLIVNSDSEEPMDELFFQIYKYIVETIDKKDYLVTFGIDEIKDDISQLQEGCERALKALDGMLVSGRGEIYFYEADIHEGNVSYYFPKNSVLRLSKYIKEGKINEIHEFLQEIYKKNLEKKTVTPMMIHALVDELHLTTLKCIKEITVSNTVRVSIEKIAEVATLEEIIAYYSAIYETLILELSKGNVDIKENQGIDKTIIAYINENYCNPDISIQHLSDKFGVSGKYISLICKNQLGTTYLQYVQEMRIKHALQLLETTEYSLEQIGEMCGYINALTFRRNFKTYTGMNPSDYRSQ